MNQKNFDYLKDGLKYLGFGEGLNNKLAEELASGKPEFQINTVNEYGRDKVNYKLDFRKSDQSDMYFFNKYTANFKPEGNSPEKAQTSSSSATISSRKPPCGSSVCGSRNP